MSKHIILTGLNEELSPEIDLVLFVSGCHSVVSLIDFGQR
jgi:hypothetical protein